MTLAVGDLLYYSSLAVIPMPPFYSNPQLGLTIPIVSSAGTLGLPSVVVAGIPTGATVVRAKPILIYRIIDNLAATLNKLSGATVANTSQVIQIKKGAGSWVDCLTFLDDQLSMPALSREGGSPLVCGLDMSATVTGNDTYTFQWLLAGADAASLYLQGVHMILQIAYSLP
jgi:hypothetical protein